MSPAPQAERIRQAVMRSVQSRDLYTEQQVKKMMGALRQAETGVKAESGGGCLQPGGSQGAGFPDQL